MQEKRARKDAEGGLKKKLVTLVCGQSSLVLGAVFHILAEDNTGEFDPYFIERMKNSL